MSVPRRLDQAQMPDGSSGFRALCFSIVRLAPHGVPPHCATEKSSQIGVNERWENIVNCDEPCGEIERPQLRSRADRHLLRRRAYWTIYRVCTGRSEEHTSELQSLMRNSYAV